MNRYGALAKNHWQNTDPKRYEAIENPETFFQELGEQTESEVQALAEHLAGPDRPGETYLEKVGRLNMARLQAEERVLSDLVWIAPSPLQEEPEEAITHGLEQGRQELGEILSERDPHEEP